MHRVCCVIEASHTQYSINVYLSVRIRWRLVDTIIFGQSEIELESCSNKSSPYLNVTLAVLYDSVTIMRVIIELETIKHTEIPRKDDGNSNCVTSVLF